MNSEWEYWNTENFSEEAKTKSTHRTKGDSNDFCDKAHGSMCNFSIQAVQRLTGQGHLMSTKETALV